MWEEGRERPMDDIGWRLASRLPMIAILRGITPPEAGDVADALVQAGFEIVEVTLNSPDPLASIEHIASRVGGSALVGAGTVTRADQVESVANAGGRLVISPHYDRNIVTRTVAAGLVSLPGVFTPSEMFDALDAGAAGLKIFPAEAFPPQAVKAVRAVLPGEIDIYVVGGITGDAMRSYLQAGATGFGIGGTLYKAGKPAIAVERDAKMVLDKFKGIRQSL